MKLMPSPSRQHRLLTLALLFACLSPITAAAQPLSTDTPQLLRDGIPNIPDQIVRSLEPYRSYQGSTLQGWGPNNGLVLKRMTATGTEYQLMTHPGARPSPHQSSPIAARYSLTRPGRSGQHLLIEQDSNGSERCSFDLWDEASQSKTRLTSNKLRYLGACWSPDGRSVATSCDARNGFDFDLTLIDDSGIHTRLSESPGMWVPRLWTSDGKQLVVSQTIGTEEERLYLFDREKRAMIALDEDPSPVWMGQPTLMGDTLLYVSNRGQEYRSLWSRNLKTGKTRLHLEKTPGDIEFFALSPNHERAVLALHGDNGYTYLYDWNLNTNRLVSCKMPAGQFDYPIYSQDGTKIAVTYHRVVGPPSICSYDFESKTFSTWVRGKVLPEAKSLPHYPTRERFRSFDGLEISAFVYRPKARFTKAPVLIDVHGGPAAQHRPFYDSTLSYLVNELGVAVIAPNVRGSTGYGKTFSSLDDNDRRMDAVKDIGALLDWIEKQPELDANRVAILGSSYGGFVCLNSLAEYPSRLRAGVDIAGVSELGRRVSDTPGVVHQIRRTEYGDETDPVVAKTLHRLSPVQRAKSISSPLLVIHGEKDPRVPIAQADNIVKAVRDNGVECWYLRAPNEGHGFRKAESLKAQRESLALFLKTYLIGTGTKPTPRYSRNDHPMTRCQTQ